MNLDNFSLDYGSSVASVGETGNENSMSSVKHCSKAHTVILPLCSKAYHLQKSAISVTTVPIPRERITGCQD